MYFNDSICRSDRSSKVAIRTNHYSYCRMGRSTCRRQCCLASRRSVCRSRCSGIGQRLRYGSEVMRVRGYDVEVGGQLMHNYSHIIIIEL